MALHSIAANRLRTFLSLLGIAIGIFSIITVFTVLDALEGSIRKGVSILGSDNLFVEKYPWTFDGESNWWDYANRPQPSYDEYMALHERMKTIQHSGFMANTSAQIAYHRAGKNKILNNVNVWMISEDFLEIYQLEIGRGRNFTPSENLLGTPLCLIGATTAEELFGNENPLGKTLKMNGKRTTVIGVFAKEGEGLVSTGVDDCYIIPYGYGKNIFDLRSDNVGTVIGVRAKPGVELKDVKDELRMVMRSDRRIAPLAKDNFSINQLSMIMQQLEKIFSMINLAGLLIGGIAILVGGFGIANIMFVSVKERTRIIGIQKAIGAKSWCVLFEFLCESVILCIVGGMIGLLLVFAGTKIVAGLADSGFVITLTLTNIIRGLLISGAAGIIAGFIPAKSASGLNPVAAMNTNF